MKRMILLFRYIVQKVHLYMINNTLLHQINDSKKLIRYRNKKSEQYQKQLTSLKEKALTKEQGLIKINQLLTEVTQLYVMYETSKNEYEKNGILLKINEINKAILHLSKQVSEINV